MSSDSSTAAPRPRRRWRKRRIALILLPFLILVVGWQVAERYIDIERYRPLIHKELEELTKLPLSFGAMDLQLLPTPRLVLEGVTLGEALFKVEAPQVSVTADLYGLLDGHLDLKTVTIHQPRIQVPASLPDFQARWGAYMLALATSDDQSGKSLLKVTLDEITAADLTIFRGDQRYAEGALTVSSVTGGSPQFHFVNTIVGMDGRPKIDSTLLLTVGSDPIIEGDATVVGLPVSELTGDDQLPPFLLDGSVHYRLSQEDRFTMDAAGTLRRGETERNLGPFSTSVVIDDSGVTLQALSIDTVPLRGHGQLHVLPGRGWSLQVDDATLDHDGVNWLLRYLPALPLRAGLSTSTRCMLEDLYLGEDGNGKFFLETGNLQTEGLDLVIDGPDYVLTGLRSTIELSKNRYVISDISSDAFHVSGALEFLEGGPAQLSLRGEGVLGPDFPLPPVLADLVHLQGGTIEIHEFNTILKAGLPVLAETQLAAEMRDGALSIRTVGPESGIILKNMGGTFGLSREKQRIVYALTGQTDFLGEVAADGDFAVAGDGDMNARVTVAPKSLARSLLSEAQWNSHGKMILADLDTTVFETRYSRDDRVLTFTTSAPQPISGTATITASGEVAELSFSTEMPMERLRSFIPEAITTAGRAELSVQYTSGTGRIAGVLTLTDAELAWKAHKKPTGFLTVVAASGRWYQGGLVDGTGVVQLGSTQTPIVLLESGLVSEHVELDLTALGPLFPSGVAISGRVRGSFTTVVPALQLHISEGILSLPGDIPPLAIDGAFAYDADRWQFRESTLSYHGQSAEVSVGYGDGVLDGTVYASAINVDQTIGDYDVLMDWWRRLYPATEDTAATWRSEVGVSVDTLTWVDTELSDLRSTVRLNADETTLSEVCFNQGEGTGAGDVIFRHGVGEEPTQVELELTLSQIELAQIEGFLAEESRSMKGLVDGHVVLSFPIPADETPAVNGMSGQVEFSATEGTLGKAGFASKFLTALRTTDILRMRIPSLRDKGITFQTLSGSLAIASGRFVLEPYRMEDTTYTLEASLELDFPENTSSGLVVLQLLDGVTSVASKIPILGDAAEMMNKALDVEFHVTGTVDEPEFRVEKLGPLKSLGNGAREMLRGTQRLLKP